ncbi:zinc ABC transporter substrate-binding protein AztC [Nitratireductor alexandrii]|uniref:zinc ABC transporter substrate-binding protein AztC n=1 Tax=Nitratireductor alexandrii TaxID=2448161 RepID=UPI000FDC5B1D|nr:zinc ABC transporter substrate-binding protein AztC [Nitratireductor alexandrii]
MRSLAQAALAGLSLAVAAPSVQAGAEPFDVVASFSIIGDFAREVGGDRIRLTTLVGPNGDAHVYEPRPADAAAMTKARVVLVNGLQFEGFLDRLIEASGTTAAVVEVSKGAHILPVDGEAHDHHADEDKAADHHHDEASDEDGHAEKDHAGHDHGAYDPHAWQSVENAERYVKNIAEAFCLTDRDGCATYQENAAAYIGQLQTLDADIKTAIGELPQDKRTIITSHDAFGYFEHEYGLHFLAPKGLSTEADASAADIAALIRQVREERASAIFVENITNPRLAEQIAAETGLQLGGALYSDALSDKDGPAATYIDLMRHNLTTITSAIAGS